MSKGAATSRCALSDHFTLCAAAVDWRNSMLSHTKNRPGQARVTENIIAACRKYLQSYESRLAIRGKIKHFQSLINLALLLHSSNKTSQSTCRKRQNRERRCHCFIKKLPVAARPPARTTRADMTSAGLSASGNQGEACLGRSKSGALQRWTVSARGFERPLPVITVIFR
jgi:hypothetical protein